MPRRELWALAGLTLLAAALRFSTLHVQSYELDEAVTVGLVKHGLWGMLDRIPHTESTPPLYYLLAWPWSRLFGTGEAGLRSLSALAGTAAVPVGYLAVRELISRRAGLVCAALAAAAPLLVWEAQEARSYALLTLIGALSLLFFARALRRDGQVRELALWAVASGAALATHYFAAFVVAPEAVWLVLAPGTVRRRAAIAAVAVVAVVGAALVPLAVEQRGHHGAEALIRDSGSLSLRVAQLPKQFLVGFDAPAEAPLAVLAGVLCAAAVVGLVARGSPAERRRAALPAALAGVALLLPLLAARAGADYFNARNSLSAWLPAAGVVAAGLSVRALPRAGATLAAGLAALGAGVCVAVAADLRYQRDDWRGAAEALGAARVSRAIVFSPGELRALQLYLPRSRPLPPRGARIAEVDVLALARHRAGEQRSAPRLDQLPPAPAGARVLERRREETFALARYRLARPARLAPGPLPPLNGKRPAILVQQGG